MTTIKIDEVLARNCETYEDITVSESHGVMLGDGANWRKYSPCTRIVDVHPLIIKYSIDMECVSMLDDMDRVRAGYRASSKVYPKVYPVTRSSYTEAAATLAHNIIQHLLAKKNTSHSIGHKPV